MYTQLCLTSLQERLASCLLHDLGLFLNCSCGYAVALCPPLDSRGQEDTLLVGVNEEVREAQDLALRNQGLG